MKLDLTKDETALLTWMLGGFVDHKTLRRISFTHQRGNDSELVPCRDLEFSILKKIKEGK